MKLGIIDYGRGNLRSVINACQALGHEATIVTAPEQIAPLSHLICPGQGAFGDCMSNLKRLGLTEPLKEWIEADRPYFGICVGYQLLFESSQESPSIAGLGVIKGRVLRFKNDPSDQSTHLKIPHMGWNSADTLQPNHPNWNNLAGEPYFYFIHSYYPEPEDDSIAATRTSYGQTFTSAIQRGRLLATQFHPEKSQYAGLTLIQNFLSQAE